jgi:DNA-binding MarR family transcriptional regulator
MRLEEEIKQSKKFSSEHERLMVNIMYTSSWLEAKNIQRLKPYGISPQQYNVLRILRGSNPKPLKLGDIASRMIDKNSNATRLVEKLRIKGLIERNICEDNRRQVDITITDKGLALLTKIDSQLTDWASVFESISSTNAQNMNDILDKIRS